jgi:hypothetical protein
MAETMQHAALMGLRNTLCKFVARFNATEAALVAVAVLACVNAMVELWRWISTPPM